jgi:hypothetical protein
VRLVIKNGLESELNLIQKRARGAIFGTAENDIKI